MKIFKHLLVVFSFLVSQTLWAAPHSTHKAHKHSALQESSFVLNPASIQHQVISGNLSVLASLYQVHDAKDQVNIARANLLPSLNLTGSIANGTGFFLSTIDFLLPFLLPSNWNNYFSQQSTFEAEKLSYKIVELNTYSSALSVYYNVLSDHQLKEIYQQEYLDLQSVFETQKRNSAIGNVPTADLLLAQAQAQQAGIKASQLAELNVSEIASLRSALNLPLSTDLSLEEVNMVETHWEYDPTPAVIAQANSVSVERQQIHYLVKAAVSQKWSKAFAFINGASLATTSFTPGKSASFSNLIGSGTVNLGFAYFPALTLSERNITEIQLQEQELLVENTRVLETALGSLQEARQQYDLATQSAEEMAKVYAIRLNNYNLGSETFTNVVLARNQWADASVSQVRAQLDLNQQRLNLYRILLIGDFASIHGCRATQFPTEHRPGFIGRLVGKQEPSHGTLDQLCRGH